MLVVRNVLPKRLAEFEEWAREMTTFAQTFAGFLGTSIIRPRDAARPEYVIVVRFDSYDHLKTFMDSPERAEYIKHSEPFTMGEISVQEMNGFESFFSLPGTTATARPPARYKMAILTLLVIYPTLLGISTIIGMLFRGYPRPLTILLTAILMVLLMTWLLMPWRRGYSDSGCIPRGSDLGAVTREA